MTIVGTLACPGNSLAQQSADTIYQGGSILRMTDIDPRAEAVAVKDGRVLAVGKTADVSKYRGDSTNMVDLAGRALLPGFVDAHGHVFGIGLQALSANMLPAPDGAVNSIAALQEALLEWAKTYEKRVKAVNLILGFGYDDAQLKELRHPTRDDLDKVSKDIPVYIIHQSGHIGVGNSKALELVKITSKTKNPIGGVI